MVYGLNAEQMKRYVRDQIQADFGKDAVAAFDECGVQPPMKPTVQLHKMEYNPQSGGSRVQANSQGVAEQRIYEQNVRLYQQNIKACKEGEALDASPYQALEAQKI
jgi:hypothetical protein